MARRSRPHMADFGDVLGHRGPLDRLRRALREDGAHHAYLFEGPEGVGKRLVALRLAMAMACEEPTVQRRPCGRCPTCRQILAGSHPDVIQIGPEPDRAAPVIPVARVRTLVSELAYHRYSARRRTVIIDPAEAMQASSANALLKTLEEPPEGTGFVLIATHASALLPTVISRCQRVRFGPVPRKELVPWLEQRRVQEPEVVARLALGCPGRALQLKGRALGRRRDLRDTIVAAVEGPLDDLYALAQRSTRGGRARWRDKVSLMLDIVEDLLRDAVVVATGGEDLIYPEHREVSKRWAQRMWPDGIARAARTLADTRTRLRVYVNGRAALDAVLTRLWTELGLGPGARMQARR